jgi:hypothetical protein
VKSPLVTALPTVNRPVAEGCPAAGFQKGRPTDDAEHIVGREIVTSGLQF